MVGLRQSYFVPCSTGMSRSFPHRRSVRYCINHPWLTTKDWPVRAFDSNAANSSATSATSDSVVNSPSTVSLSITFLTTSSSLMPSSRACSGICFSARGKAAQLRHALGRRVAHNDGRVDGADGNAGDPIWMQVRLGQRFIDPSLIGAECAALLQQESDAFEGRPVGN